MVLRFCAEGVKGLGVQGSCEGLPLVQLVQSE